MAQPVQPQEAVGSGVVELLAKLETAMLLAI
jgi:hypothetical protein